jgi:sugar O-acyltransferase (sialic acid O-acetyltransferase NeuD family)
MRERVVGIGGGGHAKVLIEILRAHSSFEVVGLLDPNPELRGKSVLGIPVLGDDSLLLDLKEKGIRHFFIGVGSVCDSSKRKRIYEEALALNMEPVSSIHPGAIISPSVEMGNGCMIMAGVVINACVKLGDNVIVNTGAVVDHDCCIASHVHVATGAHLSGGVRVGEGAHIGAGAVVRHNLNIGVGAIVGVGAAVIRDVAAKDVVVGVPARSLQHRV